MDLLLYSSFNSANASSVLLPLATRAVNTHDGNSGKHQSRTNPRHRGHHEVQTGLDDRRDGLTLVDQAIQSGGSV